MADVTIYGMPQSTYVRTVRMICAEKGVDYDFEPCAPHSPEILERSPTGKVPVFEHGDLRLYESIAIARYLDATFPEPPLQPADVRGRASMDQCVSQIQDSIYVTMIREIVLPRLGVTEASDEALAASAETLGRQLDHLDRSLQGSSHLSGDALTLADLFLAPIVFWLEKTPEGQAAIPSRAAFARWYADMQKRDSFQATIPPMPG